MSAPMIFPRVGLGGAGIGNLYRAVSDEDAIATVHAALANGLTLIDTAPYYGHGRSESRIGAALWTWRGSRPLLSSKVGRVLDPDAAPGDFGFADPLPFRPRYDYSRAGVRRCLEESLARLGVDRLDIALVHDIGRAEHGADYQGQLRVVLDEALPELEAAQTEGLVGLVGVGVNETAPVADILARAPLDCVLIAGRYTLLEQGALELLDQCAAQHVRVIVGGVFNSGLLATRPTPASTYNYAPAPGEIIERAQALWDICIEHGASPQAAALHFPLRHEAVAGVIAGARSPLEVAQIAAWRDEEPPLELWSELRRLGLVDADAPT
jgi:D-threo-aldose 1-dehydrogenase